MLGSEVADEYGGDDVSQGLIWNEMYALENTTRFTILSILVTQRINR